MRAVLVGVSRYPAMGGDRQLPAVARNLDRLEALLGEERVCGLPPGHCTVVREPADSEAVLAAVRAAAAAATGTLLVYYAGHGLTDPLKDSGALHLALPGSYEPGGTHLALDYGHIRTTLIRDAAAVPRKVVILDCCWSALAIPGTMGGGGSGGAAFAAAAAIEGTAVLTACAATQQARSPHGDLYTAFTGALIDLLDKGLPGGPPLLDVATVHAQLAARLGSRSLPAPQLGCTGAGGGIPLARNTAARPPREEHSRASRQEGAPIPAVRPSGADLRLRSRASLRAGEYDQAVRLLQGAAEAGDGEAISALAADLRRSGHYADAALLEQAAPQAVRALLTRLRTAGVL